MDIEQDYDLHCLKCGHSPINNRDCGEFDCEDGFKEVFFDDIQIEGTGDIVACHECKGTGVEWWCPSCGENLSGRLLECGLLPEEEDLDDLNW